ncbi:MAG: hypothetical protein ACRYGA_05835 [Janthinobacterium lividum]
MLTVDADDRPLVRCMHKLDPKAPPDKQDKRSVIPLEAADFDQWLEGKVEQARGPMKPAPVEIFDARPTEPPHHVLVQCKLKRKLQRNFSIWLLVFAGETHNRHGVGLTRTCDTDSKVVSSEINDSSFIGAFIRFWFRCFGQRSMVFVVLQESGSFICGEGDPVPSIANSSRYLVGQDAVCTHENVKKVLL